MGEPRADIGGRSFIDDAGEKGEPVGEVLPRAVGADDVVAIRCFDEERGRQHVALLADRMKDHIAGSVPGQPQQAGKLYQPDIGDIGHGLVRGRLARSRRLDL